MPANIVHGAFGQFSDGNNTLEITDLDGSPVSISMTGAEIRQAMTGPQRVAFAKDFVRFCFSDMQNVHMSDTVMGGILIFVKRVP